MKTETRLVQSLYLASRNSWEVLLVTRVQRNSSGPENSREKCNQDQASLKAVCQVWTPGCTPSGCALMKDLLEGLKDRCGGEVMGNCSHSTRASRSLFQGRRFGHGTGVVAGQPVQKNALSGVTQPTTGP